MTFTGDRCDSSGYFADGEDCSPEHPCRIHAARQIIEACREALIEILSIIATVPPHEMAERNARIQRVVENLSDPDVIYAGLI